MHKTLTDQAYSANRTQPDPPAQKRPIQNESDVTESDTFQERLRDLVGLEKSISFARRCGFSDSLLGAYIRGEKKPGFDNLVTITKVTGVTIDWLATGREPKYRKDVAAALRRPEAPEAAPDQASADLSELVVIYKDAPPEGRHALLVLARAIRDRTLRAWLAAGQAVAEAASLFDRSK